MCLVLLFLGPGTVIPMLEAVLDAVPVDKLAVHFHDTYGQALSNILASLQVRQLIFVYMLLKKPILALTCHCLWQSYGLFLTCFSSSKQSTFEQKFRIIILKALSMTIN